MIGLRDWGIERLEKALISHRNSRCENVEVVVSDFGSTNPQPIRRLCRKFACRYVYSAADVWSRSRALNVGLSAASADFLVTTDSDIVFSPTTLTLVVDGLRAQPDSIQLVQCRDLPEDADPSLLSWEEMHAVSTLRPRWGMGGLAAFSRDTFDRIRGFDERMEIWGAEDRDFVGRAQAFGSPAEWIDDARASIFHLWHPPFLQTSKDAEAVFNRNHAFLKEDRTIVRNRVGSSWGRFGRPLVSIVVATYNRAGRLRRAIESCLSQSVDDIEVVVWDDGSTDDTQQVLACIDDKRLRTFRSDTNCGLPATRNKANAVARGTFIAIHDDDDLMLPARLEAQLDVLDSTSQGSYGGWIDWDEETRTPQFHPGAHELSLPGLLFNSRLLLHPTVLVRADIMRAYRYEESFRAGSDYNLLARMIRDGVTLAHCGRYVILRTIHSSNMTIGNATTQKTSAKVTHSAILNMIDTATEQSLRQNAKAISPYPMDDVASWAEIQSLLPRPELAFYRHVDVAAPYSPSTIEEIAIKAGIAQSLSSYSTTPPLDQAEPAGTVEYEVPGFVTDPEGAAQIDDLSQRLSPEDAVAITLLRRQPGQIVRCQLDGGDESALAGLGSIAVDGEPLYLVRRGGIPSALLFSCKTTQEAQLRSRKALRLPAVRHVDTLAS